MSQSYESCRANLERLASWYQSNAGQRNEATTRLTMIDRLLFDCLDWPKDDVVLEEPHGQEYADYVFSVFRPVLIVEAKKEADYFELPAGQHRIEYSIPSLVKDYPKLKAALTQAAGYCQSRGVPYGAVSNGHQVVAFIGTRTDGAAPLEGKSLVFDSLDSMLKHFLDFWQALSRAGVVERKLQYRLIGGIPELPPKLSTRLSDYPGLKQRNVLQTDLQVLSEIVIEDVIRSPELEPEFLQRCYCQSGALSQYALTSKEALQARYSAMFDSENPGPPLSPATTKDGISRELLGASLARRPILLLGDVGVGKTTFIRHLINVDAKDVFKNAVFFHIDLASRGALALDLRVHVMDELQRLLLEQYKIDVLERSFIHGVYHAELTRFASGLYSDLKASFPEKFVEKEIGYLEELVKNKEQHLRKSMTHISCARRKQIVLFLDNADQRDERTQEVVFLIAQEFAETWPVMVFVALRPETFHRSKKIGALTGYHAKAFTIAPPRIDQVLQKRLDFASMLTTGRLPLSRLEKVAINLDKLTTIIDVVRESLQNTPLMEFIENIAAGNVRLALDLIRDFIGSGHVDTQKILDIVANSGEYDIPLHEFLRAIIYGDAEYYDPSVSPIANLFDISACDGKEHFILPLLLGLLHRSTGPDVKEGFVDTAKAYEALQAMGYIPEQIDNVLSRACEKKLIETSSRRIPEPGQIMPSALRITSSGEYHRQRLPHQFQYIDAIVTDTPVLNKVVRDMIRDTQTLNQRLDRAEVFVQYLDGEWQAVKSHAVGFDWHIDSLRLKEQFRQIRHN